MSALGGSLLVAGGAAAPSLLTGLVGYWKLNGNSNDSLGVSNGADTLVSYVTGKISQGASFASTGFVNVGTASQIKPTSAITVAGWFKYNSFQGNARDCSDWHQSTVADRWILGLESGAGGDVLAVAANAGEISAVMPHLGTGLAGGVLVTGTWYHLALTYDGSIVRAYRDGAQVDSASLSGAMNGGGPAVRFGTQLEAGITMDGIIDDVGIWNRALSGSEFTTLYNGGAGLSYPF